MLLRQILLFWAAITSGILLNACDGGSSAESNTSSVTPVVEAQDAQEEAEEEQVANVIPAGADIDVRMASFVEAFLDEADQRGVVVDLSDLSIQFEDLEGEAIGVCFFEQKQIFIERAFIDADPIFLYEIIIHELGHCALGMHHRPDSLMSAEGFVGVTPELLDEFFTERYFHQIDLEIVSLKYP